MSFNAYWAYGLRIHSEIVCPELLLHSHPEGAPDVVIRLLAPIASLSSSLENGYYEVRPGLFRMSVSGIAQYTVEEGRRITVEPLAGATPEEVRLFLLGSAMGALLYQRGLFPLHGSAVETRWGAMIFVGAQGVGKSTLASQFYRSGYRLLSDDVCAVAPCRAGLQVLPALAHFRLCSDAYERLGDQPQARFDVDKFVVPLGEGYCREPQPLKAVHILGNKDDGEPDFELLRGFDRVERLFENLYRPHYLKGQETQLPLMRMAGEIAKNATMVAVTRRRDVAALPEFVGFLESQWSQHFGPGPLKEM